MNTRILDVSFPIGRELLAQIIGMLIFDVLYNRVPATIVVHKVTIPWRVHNIQLQPHAILFNDVRNCLDLCGGLDPFVGSQSTLGINQVRGEYGVDQRRLSQSCLTWPLIAFIRVNRGIRLGEILTNAYDIELETAFQELALDLGGKRVKPDLSLWHHDRWHWWQTPVVDCCSWRLWWSSLVSGVKSHSPPRRSGVHL